MIGGAAGRLHDGYDLSSITDPLTRSVTLRTDAIGRTVSTTDPLTQRSINTIDSVDRITSITDPTSQNTGFGYDNNDNLTSVTDANTHSTGFSYDDRNAVTGKTDALSQGSSIVYDNEHRIKQSTDRKNQTTKYQYDSLNRLRTVTYADSSTITHTYDNGNRLTQLADSQNGNISFVYDNLDRITQVTSPKGVVNYTYDANGQRSTMSITGQPTQSYTYDKAGRLTRIDQAAGPVNNNQAQAIQFVYDDAGRRTKTIHANGIVQDYSYDDGNQLTGITYKKADNSIIGDLTYGYDDGGRRTRKGGSLAKTDLPDTVTTTSYDANNRLTTWGNQILSYDKNGNLTGDGINTYVWNARNQLVQIKDSTNTEIASFTYDALGRRQTKTVSGVSTGFVYDGVNIVQELNGLNTTQADTANIRASYVTAGVDQVLVQQSESGSTATSLTYLTDAIGSTIRLTNATGDKVVDYSYDPYGNTRADAVVNNAFQYTGRENDGNGLYYYRARYYSPATHQFIAEDPIGLAGGINGYGYVEGDPISTIDPYGLFGMDDIYGGIYNATNGWSPSQSNINAVVGFGDGAYKAATLGFGNLQDIRDFAGIEGDIDKCSSMYKGFNTAGNIAGGIAMVGPAGNILGRFFGPMKQWVRVGASYSKASGQHVAMSIRWGASPIGKGKYIQQIPSKMLQNFNQWLRAQKIPFSGWRGKDSGHFHLW